MGCTDKLTYTENWHVRWERWLTGFVSFSRQALFLLVPAAAKMLQLTSVICWMLSGYKRAHKLEPIVLHAVSSNLHQVQLLREILTFLPCTHLSFCCCFCFFCGVIICRNMRANQPGPKVRPDLEKAWNGMWDISKEFSHDCWGRIPAPSWHSSGTKLNRCHR